MAGLSIPVDAPGLGATTTGMDRLSTSATKAAGSMVQVGTQAGKAGGAMDALMRKAQSGGAIQNAAASFTILAATTGNAYEKITALSAGFTMIPGPLGLVAVGVTAAASALNVLTKAAKGSKDELAELEKTLGELAKRKGEAQEALAGRIGAAAGRVGDDLRAGLATGGAGRAAGLQGLFPGDPNAALRTGTMLAEANLTASQEAQAASIMRDARNIGTKITDDVVRSIISTVRNVSTAYAPVDEETIMAAAKARDEAAARGGGIFGPSVPFRGLEAAPNRAGLLLDALNTPSDQVGAVMSRFAQSTSGAGVARLNALAGAESPAVADSIRTIADAQRADTVSQDALRASTEKAAGATDELAKTIRDLDKTIRDTSQQARQLSKPPPESGWTFSWTRPSAAGAP